MPIINFSPTFNPNYYRDAHPELNLLDDEDLTAHCQKFADAQGLSTCPYDRREFLHKFLQTAIDERQLKVLEIGCGGFPFLVGKTVKYFETLTVEELKQQYIQRGRNVDGFPKNFDFVSATGDLGIVDEKFDIVFSSHVVEHCPDLIKHFQDVAKLLNKGGLYVLIVPDKRYCFDHFNPESSISDVIEAFVYERKNPRLADVINTIFTRAHNSSSFHWLGEHGLRFGLRNAPPDSDASTTSLLGETLVDDGKNLPEKILRLVEKYAETLEHGEYISAHNWRFTSDSFGYIVNVLNALHFINLPIYRLCRTIWGRLEFIAMLEKT